MKKRYYCILLILLCVLALSARGNSTDESQSVRPPIEQAPQSMESPGGEEEDTLTGSTRMQEMTVEVGGQKFQAALYDNETVRALKERFPMTLDMEELHGNEKFYYLDEGLPANSENISNIKAGDIMLFGSDCLVLFFEDFSTSYNYTRIGHIEEEEAFVKALPEGTVEVTFEAGE